jgi:death-on-curing protein
MEIFLDEDWLIFFYETLVGLYQDTEDPITFGYSKGLLHVCVERPQTDIYDLIPFPHLLHKAAVLMDTIISFHPFADGNKRVALLATFYFLYWNGYDFVIPEDAADFTIEIAKGKYNLNKILLWLKQNSRSTFLSLFRNRVLFRICIFLGEERYGLSELLMPFASLIVPLEPFMFVERVRHKKEVGGKQK